MGYRTRYAKNAGALRNTQWEYYVKDEYVGKRMFARRVGKKAKGRKKVYEIFEWKKWSRH